MYFVFIVSFFEQLNFTTNLFCKSNHIFIVILIFFVKFRKLTYSNLIQVKRMYVFLMINVLSYITYLHFYCLVLIFLILVHE